MSVQGIFYIAASELRSQPRGERNLGFKDADGHEWSYGEIEGGE
jgi:hypothetical protein